MSQRKLQSDLKELSFHFQSLQLFLEHLELRFGKLLPQLEHLLPQWQTRETQNGNLEQELDATYQEVFLLQHQLDAAQEVVAGYQAQQNQWQKEYWQGEIQELELLYQKLWQALTHSQNRFQAIENLVMNLRESLLEQDRKISVLQQDNHNLERTLQTFEQTEQEYVSLLGHKEQQIQELRTLYEFELEQLSQELQHSAHHEQNRQQQSQSIGKSLAKLAQERNSVLQNQQELREALLALEQDNQQLQDNLDASEAELESLSSSEDQWQLSGQSLSAEVLIYRAFWETIHGLGLNLPDELMQYVAEQLKLRPLTQEHLEARLNLQSGILAQSLSHWRQENPFELLQSSSQTSSQGSHKQSQIQAFVSIPAGQYLLGDDLQAAERPQHSWQNPGFQLGRLLVTNADYAHFITSGAYQNPDYWLPEGWRLCSAEDWQAPAFWNKRGYQCGERFPDYPVIGVSWYEAMAYASWAESRLPSEAEWEAAGRCGDTRRWPWGDEWLEGCANTADAGIMHTSPVGLYPEGASDFGCLDLVGNVFEWTVSLYQAYPYTVDDGREDLRSTAPRTLRGCSWNHKGAYFTRLSYRFQAEPATRHSDIGFRLARDQA